MNSTNGQDKAPKAKPITIIINSRLPEVKKFELPDGRCVVITRQDKVYDVGEDDPTNPTLAYSTFTVAYHVDIASSERIPFLLVVKTGDRPPKQHDAPLGEVADVGLTYDPWLLRDGRTDELVITPKE